MTPRVPATEKEAALVTALVKLSKAVETLAGDVVSLRRRVRALEAAANGGLSDDAEEELA